MKRMDLTAIVFLAHFILYTPGTLAALAPLSEPANLELRDVIKDELFGLMLTDVTTTNSSLFNIAEQLGTCLETIESKKNSCISCVQQKCEERVTALQCGVTVDAGSSGGCNLFPAICKLKEAQEKATAAVVQGTLKASVVIVNGLILVGKEIEGVAVKVGDGVVDVAEDIGKVAEQAGKTIVDGAKTAAEDIKKTAEGIAKDIGNVAEGIAKEVGNIGDKIASGVEEVGEKIVDGAETVGKTVIGGIKDLFNKIGRRRRQASAPTCTELSNNSSACTYYQSACSDCTVLELAESENVEPLIRSVCGAEVADNFIKFDALYARIFKLNDTFVTFSVSQIQLDGSTFMGTGFSVVETTYEVLSEVYKILASEPVMPFTTNEAGPIMAKDIFNELFPTIA